MVHQVKLEVPIEELDTTRNRFHHLIWRLIFFVIALIIVSLTYVMSDRTPPSDFIASWIMTRDVYPGSLFSARYILVRHRPCYKRIETAVIQGSASYPVNQSELEHGPVGLDILTIEMKMNNEVAVGHATVESTFIWRCPPWNIIHWLKPITFTTDMPVEIKRAPPPETKVEKVTTIIMIPVPVPTKDKRFISTGGE